MENRIYNTEINFSKVMNYKSSFKGVLNKYDQEFQNSQSPTVQLIDSKCHFISTVYVFLGMDRVRELNYTLKKINNELFDYFSDAIKKLVLQIIEKNRAYPISSVKKALNLIYSQFDIDKKAKSTDLSLLFVTKASFINDNTGKTVRNITILE